VRKPHGWGGQEVSIGEAILRVIASVPRCVVTTRNPDSGPTDARVLHALARLRRKNDITFGVWCDIIRRGGIRIGDLVIGPEPSTDFSWTDLTGQGYGRRDRHPAGHSPADTY